MCLCCVKWQRAFRIAINSMSSLTSLERLVLQYWIPPLVNLLKRQERLECLAVPFDEEDSVLLEIASSCTRLRALSITRKIDRSTSRSALLKNISALTRCKQLESLRLDNQSSLEESSLAEVLSVCQR